MNDENKHSPYTKNEKLAVGAVAVAALGLVVGGAVAADKISQTPPGHHTEVDFTPPDTTAPIVSEK